MKTIEKIHKSCNICELKIGDIFCFIDIPTLYIYAGNKLDKSYYYHSIIIKEEIEMNIKVNKLTFKN